MEIDSVLDTILNVVVFCFLGVLIWLYLREEADDLDFATDEETVRPSPTVVSSEATSLRGGTSVESEGREPSSRSNA